MKQPHTSDLLHPSERCSTVESHWQPARRSGGRSGTIGLWWSSSLLYEMSRKSTVLIVRTLVHFEGQGQKRWHLVTAHFSPVLVFLFGFGFGL